MRNFHSDLRPRIDRERQERHIWSVRDGPGRQSEEANEDHAEGIESCLAREVLLVSNSITRRFYREKKKKRKENRTLKFVILILKNRSILQNPYYIYFKKENCLRVYPPNHFCSCSKYSNKWNVRKNNSKLYLYLIINYINNFNWKIFLF